MHWRDDAVRAAVVRQAEAAAAGTREEIDVDEAVKRLDLPLGDEPTQLPNDALAWVAKLLGLALTVGAVMLGAPFWFDLLSKARPIGGLTASITDSTLRPFNCGRP